ncbi:MAG: metal-sensing transcriptional repressor [Butyrivibrio sp.]|nr:metal-sensing transcriptional repressor [Butyrivibrio sp.]
MSKSEINSAENEHLHSIHSHGHYHSPEHKKKLTNRMARIIGHMEKIKDMIDNDEDCAEILIQLAAVESATKSLGKVIINEHISHCIIHAMEDGDMKSIEEFKKAIEKFL